MCRFFIVFGLNWHFTLSLFEHKFELTKHKMSIVSKVNKNWQHVRTLVRNFDEQLCCLSSDRL